jgi:diacylglycerol kinase (ATP)
LRGKGRKRLDAAVRALAEAGHEATLTPTTGPRTAAGIAKTAIAGGAQMVLAAGGDGTINEVLEGMVHSRVPLGILPAGTANVLANEMGIACDAEAAARNLVRCKPERISVGRAHFTDSEPGTRHFLLMAGAGLDALMVYRISAPLKSRTGKLAYWVSGLSLLGKPLEEFSVRVDEGEFRCSFALISKVRNYGGAFQIARDTSLFDARFEVVLFEGTRSSRYLKYFAGVMLNRVQGMRGVKVLRSRKVCLAAPADARVYLQVDGEYAGRLPGSVEIVEDAITLMVPVEYKTRMATNEH